MEVGRGVDAYINSVSAVWNLVNSLEFAKNTLIHYLIAIIEVENYELRRQYAMNP